jgi:hypothetical protein
MKLAIEVPDLPDQFEETLGAADREDCWDGLAVSGRTINATTNWEDLIEATDTPWSLLDGLLPEEIASQLTDLDAAPRAKLMAHATDLLQRTASLELTCATLDLALDRLVWSPPANGAIAAGLTARCDLLGSLMPEAQRLGCRLCVSLRYPLPTVIQDAASLTLQLLDQFGHPDCRLMLNVIVDELPTLDPATVLEPFRKWLHVLRIRYEPALGIHLTPADQRQWRAYLHEREFDGLVVMAPVLGSTDAFRAELRRLGPEIAQFWR